MKHAWRQSKQLHFNVGLTGGAGRAAGWLFASTDCPFTADVVLLTLPGGALALLFSVELLFDWDCASVDVTVVLDTCREPDDRLPLDDPEEREKERRQRSMTGGHKERSMVFANLGNDSHLSLANSGFHAMKCAAAAGPSAGCRSSDCRAARFL